jgi:hypothetical protein
MPAEKFNSLGGFSTNIPPIQVIDDNGNLISNVSTTGNVSANTIFASNYRHANGAPFNPIASAGGSNTQLQFNNLNLIDGIPNVTWNGTKLSLGNISNVTISGGQNGYVLATDGNGTLSWEINHGSNISPNANVIVNIPGGSNTNIQFNDAGNFAGQSNFTFNKITQTLTVARINANTISGNISGNIAASTANYVIQPIQSNIISLGTLTSLNVSGSINAPSLNLTNALSVSGNTLLNSKLTVLGNVNLSSSPNISLGAISNIHISGGTNGQILSTDGLGALFWITPGSSNALPGGANTQIQFNNTSTFAGSANLTYNSTTNSLNMNGNLIANSIQFGSGIHSFCRAEVYSAMTASTMTNQILYTVPSLNISGVDFHIIATDQTNASRQSVKISSTIYDSFLQFNEYAGLEVNGGTGTFNIIYDAFTSSIQLRTTPQTTNSIVYRMLITIYNN